MPYDPFEHLRRRPGVIDLGPVNQALDETADRIDDTLQEGEARISLMAQQRAEAQRPMVEPAEFAFNPKTGEVMLPNGAIVKADAPTIVQLATLRAVDGTPLPKLDPAKVPKGWVLKSQTQIAKTIEEIPTDSDFFGELWASGKTSLGLMASTIDSMFGSDDPSNSWSRAKQEHAKTQTIGQYKAAQGRWYSSWDSFISSLGDTVGNIGGNIVGAVPLAVAGTAAGGPKGAVVAGAAGVTGFAGAFGEQATDFYDAAVEAMLPMSPDRLVSESPLYREVVRERPGITHEEAVREVAIRGARVAGTTAGALGAAESMVGAKLAGNLVARIGFKKSVLGALGGETAKRTGALPTAARVTGRTVAGGAGAAAEEMGETMFGQAAGAAYTGVGSTNPLDYANADEGWQAALGGMLFGALGGRARSDAAAALAQSDLGDALAAAPTPSVDATAAPGGAATAAPGPAATAPEPVGRALEALPGLERPAYERRPVGRAQAALPTSFDDAVERVLQEEGGYVDDPADRGGATNYGISSRANPDVDVKGLTRDEAKRLYRERYWDAINADALPPEMRAIAFDAAVNQGVGWTKAALRQANGDPARFAELRRQRYRQIAQDDPSQRRFLRGWLARVDRYAGTDPSEAALPGLERPAYERRPVGPIQPARPEPMPPAENPDQVEARIHSVLSERFGPNWPDRLDEVSQDPAGRQLVGQLIDLERQRRAEAEPPAYERRAQPEPVPAGQPDLQSPVFEQGRVPAPPPEPLASEDDGTRVPPNLIERRTWQRMQQEERLRASEQNPALLPQSDRSRVEQEILDLEDEIEQLQAALEQRPPRDPRKKHLRAALQDAQRRLADAETRWAELQQAEDLAAGAADQRPFGERVPAPEPLEAPQERAPSGDRPMGVAPEPLPNPEPMSPEEAQARAATAAKRRAKAGLDPSEAPTPEEVQAAAQASAQRVSPSTPEPVEDLQAQVQAMLDPETERDAVFVADSQSDVVARLTRGLRGKVLVVARRGVGTLLTTNPEKARRFRTARLNDAALAQILGYSEPKGEVIARGEAPVVVQARTRKGVAAEQIASRDGVPAARAAVARQAPRDAQVVETTPEDAQARRAALGPKGAAVVAKAKERATRSPKKTLKRKVDDEETRADDQEQEARTRGERALAGASREAQAPAASTADTVERAATRGRATVTVRGQATELPTRLTQRTGVKGAAVDLRVESIDDEARLRAERLLIQALSPADRTRVEALIRDFDQLDTMLDAAVTAAEERLRKVVEAAPDGVEFTREAEKRQLELENAAAQGQRGRPRTKPRTSPLAYLPLMVSESRGFLRALRAEARAELQAGYRPAKSVARQMISAIHSQWDALLSDERQGAQVLRTFAQLTDEQLEQVLHSTHLRIQDSTVAKQVMRGATEVAHAIRRFEGELTRHAAPDTADHVSDRQTPHTIEVGEIPEAARGVVNAWAEQFERGGHKLSAPIEVMSMAEALRRYPRGFTPGRMLPYGKFMRITENGRLTRYVIAVNWSALHSDAYGVEVLAHEFGHVVTTELYERADPRTRQAIDRAYKTWLSLQEGRSVEDVMREQFPAVTRAAFKTGAVPREYALSFWEWSARNAALYILDPKRPHLTAVERFFAKVGEVLRKIYERVIGPRTDRAWEEAMDAWIAGTMQVRPMPNLRDATFHHEADAEVEVTGGALARTLARRATAPLAPLRDVFAGEKPTREAVLDAARTVADQILQSKPGNLTKVLGLSLSTMRQIERMYRNTPLGPALSGWVRNQLAKAKTANRELEAGSRWMELANQLDARVRTTLEQVMYYATHYKVHPDLAFDDAKNKHLARGSDIVVQENQRRYTRVRALYDAMVKADSTTAEIYAGLRDAFVNLHQRTLDKLLENVDASEFSDKAKEEMKARIKTAQRQLREGPYFPLMRFGDWIVTVQLPSYVVGKGGQQDGEFFDSKAEAREEARNQAALNLGARVTVEAIDGQWAVRVYQRAVYFFESELEANRRMPDIEREVREHYSAAGVDFDAAREVIEGGEDGATIISRPRKARDDYATSKQASPEFTREVQHLLKEGKLDPEVAATLERLAAEALPEHSYRQALLPRQNVLGASKHMLRAYAHRFQGAAHHYAVVEHGRAINKNWTEAWRVVTKGGFEQGADALNVLHRNQKAVAERMKPTPGNRAMNFITDLSSLISLGFSPAYVLANATQPWTVTLPVLAGLTKGDGNPVGMAKAGQYLKDAYSGAVDFFSKRGFQDFINEARAIANRRGSGATLQDSAKEILQRFAKTDEERAMLESLLERGTLDFSWLNSLEDAMRGGAMAQKWAALQRMAMAFPQQVEAMNRVVTALAAFRLARDENIPVDSMIEFADDIVADTQLDYSRMNRPLAFNLPGLNVILQFKLFMQGMYVLFARHVVMAMRGATPEERRQGRRTFAYLMATHAAVAGAAGLGPITWMAKLGLLAFAAISDDEDDDWKSGSQLMREMLQDLFGEYGGVVAEKGLPAILGVDTSDRLGLPVPFDSRYANIRQDDSPGTTLDKVVLYSLGAPYANLKRIATLPFADSQNELISSLPTVLRQAVRSAVWAREGVVDRDGDTFIPASELGWNDLAVTALGLPSLKTSTAYTERSERKETMARIMAERKRLMQAARTGDDVGDEIREFNARVPRAFKIDTADLRKSAEAKRDRERGELSKQEAAVKRMLGG